MSARRGVFAMLGGAWHRKTAFAYAGFMLLTMHAGGEPMIIEGVDKYRVMEPLFEGVRIVLAHRGEEYSPAYIQGISGAAFRIAGPCPCAPTCSVAMTTQELIELLGYECRELPIGGPGPAQVGRLRKVLEQLRQEVRAGRPVLVWNAFTSYEFDVVCGYDEAKKQLIGRGSYVGNGEQLGRSAEMRPLKGADVGMPAAMLIGRNARPFNAREAELGALEEAVRHAHSARDRWLDEAKDVEKPWRLREGFACYDVWIDNFRKNPRRVPGNGDRYCLGVYMSTHRAAAAFMRELLPKYPRSRGSLERAAVAFAAEADALDELRKLTGWNWGSKAKPDPERAARAVQLLQRARDHYAQGIEQVEQALRTIAPERAKRARRVARIRRKDGRVWIDFIQKLRWGKANTFAGALFETLRATDHPYAYHEIMGLTGLAFRVRWGNDDTKTKWCHSCAIGEMPDEMDLARKLMGWRFSMDWTEADGRDNDALRKKIVASIDAGKPVMAYPSALNMGVVYGYEDGGKTLLVSDYQAQDLPARLPVETLGPMHVYLDDWEQPPSLRDSFLDALRTTALNWRRERHHGGLKDREYWYGDAALGAWLKDLRNFEKMPNDTRKQLHELDEWNFKALFDARRSARMFLGDFARLLRGDAQQVLKTAAELYQKEVATLQPIHKARKNRERNPENWAPEERSREIEALTAARKLEAAAIAAIEGALQAEGVGL